MDSDGYSPSDFAEEQAWEEFNLTRMARDHDYRQWCEDNGLDPEDTQTMIAYERDWISRRASEEEYEGWTREWPGYATC